MHDLGLGFEKTCSFSLGLAVCDLDYVTRQKNVSEVMRYTRAACSYLEAANLFLGISNDQLENNVAEQLTDQQGCKQVSLVRVSSLVTSYKFEYRVESSHFV